MAILATLPLLAFVAFLLLELERSQFAALRKDTAQDAQAIGAAVERKLADLETTLALVANSVELQQGNLAAFHARVAESVKGSSLYVILARSDGVQVLNTRVPWGAALRPMANPASVVSALRSGKVELSGVFFGATSQRWVVNLTMPVADRAEAGSAEVDAVVLTQDAESLGDIASREALPPGWTSALVDNEGRIVVSCPDWPGPACSDPRLSVVEPYPLIGEPPVNLGIALCPVAPGIVGTHGLKLQVCTCALVTIGLRGPPDRVTKTVRADRVELQAGGRLCRNRGVIGVDDRFRQPTGTASPPERSHSAARRAA
jgi:hypothetical protein